MVFGLDVHAKHWFLGQLLRLRSIYIADELHDRPSRGRGKHHPHPHVRAGRRTLWNTASLQSQVQLERRPAGSVPDRLCQHRYHHGCLRRTEPANGNACHLPEWCLRRRQVPGRQHATGDLHLQPTDRAVSRHRWDPNRHSHVDHRLVLARGGYVCLDRQRPKRHRAGDPASAARLFQHFADRAADGGVGWNARLPDRGDEYEPLRLECRRHPRHCHDRRHAPFGRLRLGHHSGCCQLGTVQYRRQYAGELPGPDARGRLHRNPDGERADHGSHLLWNRGQLRSGDPMAARRGSVRTRPIRCGYHPDTLQLDPGIAAGNGRFLPRWRLH